MLCSETSSRTTSDSIASPILFVIAAGGQNRHIIYHLQWKNVSATTKFRSYLTLVCARNSSPSIKVHPHHGPQDKAATYNLTARSGSRRYMAPEVARSLPYNEKADVYSFGILLYQMASLLKPFEGYSLVEHEDEVLFRDHRPNIEIPSSEGSTCSSYSRWFVPRSAVKSKDLLELRTKCVWTEDLKQLIEECWQGDMRLRPEMHDVVIRLERCLKELTSVKQSIVSSKSHEGKRMNILDRCVSSGSQKNA